MPKKRKTLQQKLHADQNRQTDYGEKQSVANPKSETSSSQQVTFSLPTSYSASKQTHRSAPTVAISTDSYAYLGKDLLKTALLSCSVVIVELLIRYFFMS